MAVQVNETDRKRAIRRTTLWLALLAAGFYVGFILLTVLGSK